MATPPKGPPGPEFEVPDLDVEASVRPAPIRRQSGGRVSRKVEPDPLGEGLDLEAHAATSLELATGGELSAPAPGAATMDQYFGGAFDGTASSDLEIDDGGALPLEPVAAFDDTPWPSGLTPARLDLAIDPARVEAAAGYGPPGPLLLAPLYSYRVFTRRRVIRQQLTECERALDQAENERADLLRQMVQSRRAEIEKNERFARLIEPLTGLETQAKERQQAMTRVHGELSSKVAVFDSKLKELEGERQARQQVASERRAEHAVAEEHFGRAHAKHKRVQIEIRNLEAKVREVVGPEGGVVPPELARKLRPLQEQLRALEPNVTSAEAALHAASARLAEADASVAEATRTMSAVDKDKRTLISKFETKIAATSASLRDAESQERDAFLAIARAVLDLRGAIPVDSDTRKQIAAADRLVETRLVEHELHARALEQFDHERLSLGHKMVIGLGVLVLAVVLLSLLF